MEPHSHVEDEWDDDADGRKDGQVDTHLVDVIYQTIRRFAALLTPDDAGLVHYSPNNLIKMCFIVWEKYKDYKNLLKATGG